MIGPLPDSAAGILPRSRLAALRMEVRRISALPRDASAAEVLGSGVDGDFERSFRALAYLHPDSLVPRSSAETPVWTAAFIRATAAVARLRTPVAASPSPVTQPHGQPRSWRPVAVVGRTTATILVATILVAVMAVAVAYLLQRVGPWTLTGSCVRTADPRHQLSLSSIAGNGAELVELFPGEDEPTFQYYHETGCCSVADAGRVALRLFSADLGQRCATARARDVPGTPLGTHKACELLFLLRSRAELRL